MVSESEIGCICNLEIYTGEETAGNNIISPTTLSWFMTP